MNLAVANGSITTGIVHTGNIVRMRVNLRLGWELARWMLMAFCGPLISIQAQPRSAQPHSPVCQAHPPYFVVVRQRTDSLNSDVLVKFGNGQRQCVYQAEPADYELQAVNTNRFVKLAGRYLFLGGGTAPDIESFAVYDLVARTKIYEHAYMENSFRLTESMVWFTEPLGRAAPERCKDYDRIVKLGQTPTMEGDVSFSLDDLAHPERLGSLVSSNLRCVATQ